MKAEMPKTRKRLIISGNVQQAGYRVLVKTIARSMGIVGFVRNLPDETVALVCEGEPKTLQRFLKAIDRKGDVASPMDIHIVSMEETPAPTEGEFKQFTIEYDGKLTPEQRERNREDREERMVLGASMLNWKMDGLGQKMDCVGQKVDGVGNAVAGVGQKIDSMHSDMNKRFDHMAERYDMIAASLKDAIVHMDRNAAKTDRAIEKSRKESAAESVRTRKEIAKSHSETTRELARSRKETIFAVRKSEERTAKIIADSRKEVAASNRELAGAIKFMIRKMSDKPVRRPPSKKRKR
jgi:acylphosphatase